MFQTGLLTRKVFWLMLAALAGGLIVFFVITKNSTTEQRKSTPSLSNVIIKEFLPNNNGDIDKLVIEDGSLTQTIHFPPHAASAITQRFKKDDIVTVVHGLKPHGPQKNTELLSLQKNDDLLMIRNIRPPVPSSGDSVSLELKQFEVQTNDKHHITGIKTSEYYIPLPPHLLKANIAAPYRISVKGLVRDSLAGFVNIYGRRLLKPYSVTINNTNFIL